jgi:hypothetical protein
MFNWLKIQIEKSNLTVPFLYFIALLFCFYPIFSGHASIQWDACDLWMTWKHFIVEELYNGQLPLWNPYHANGFPQHGDSMTWYPISWFFGFLFGTYNLNSLNFEYLFHLFVAGLGFYHFSGIFSQNKNIRFLLGLSFMLSGFMIGNAQHVAWIISAAWMPWFFLLLHQIFKSFTYQKLLKFTLVAFLLFSGGYLAIFFVILYITIAYVLYKFWKLKIISLISKTSLHLGIAFVLILLLSLPLLLSLLEIFPLFNRFDASSPSFNLNLGATPLNGIFAIFLPFSTAIYNLKELEFGTFSSYLGMIPVLLIIVNFKTILSNKKTLFLLLAAVLFLLISMGDAFPFRKALSYLPLMDLFRYPTLFRLFFIFLILIVVGISFEERKITNLSFSKKYKLYFIISSILLIVLSVLIFKKIDLEQLKHYLKYLEQFKAFENLNFGTRVLLNLLFILCVNSLVFLIIWRKKTIKVIRYLVIFGVLEILFITYTTAPHAVYYEVNVKFANKLIDYQAKNYPPQIKNHEENEKNLWTNYLDFSWQGKTFYLKQFSSNWYNPLSLKYNEQIESPVKISDSLISTLPLYCIVSNKNIEKIKEKNIQFRVLNNQHFQFTYLDSVTKNEYLFFKQLHVSEWKAYVKNKEIPILVSKSGFMFVDAKYLAQTIDFNYENNNYKIAFLVFIITFLLILISLFILSKNKKEIISLTVILFILMSYNNWERFQNIEQLKVYQINKIDKKTLDTQDHFKQVDYWKNLGDSVLLKQNYPKTDAAISYLEFFYKKTNKIFLVDKQKFELLKRKKESYNVLISLKNISKNNSFQVDLVDLIMKKKLQNKVIYIKLVYSAPNDIKYKLWLSQTRNNEWLRGKAWSLNSKQLVEEKSDKIIIQAIDLSRYRLLQEDKLSLFIWDEKETGNIKIKEFQILQ